MSNEKNKVGPVQDGVEDVGTMSSTITDLETSIKANMGKEGLTPQQERALARLKAAKVAPNEKVAQAHLEVARRFLSGKQTKPIKRD